MSWIPYGSTNDLEPPDEEFAHLECWEAHKDQQPLIKHVSWCQPAASYPNTREEDESLGSL